MAKDVGSANFQQAVIERSATLPVVVDFWAEWCGPCRALGPVLEAEAAKRAGSLELVKVDTDANQELAGRYGIQGIPAVKAFRDGEVVAEFVGAQPAPAVARFLDGLVPSEADELVAKGDPESLRKALELEPGRADAATILARSALESGNADDARAMLAQVRGDFTADGLLAWAELADGDEQLPPELDQALTALGAGDTPQALDRLAASLAVVDGDTKEQVRKIMVALFNQLGADHELSREYRRKLAASLY